MNLVAVDPGTIIADVQRQIGMLDWRIEWEWCPAGTLEIPGALAVCRALPERSFARIVIAQPWPGDEDLAETIRHEVVHALLSPLTQLIPMSDAAVMLEETIVEKLGIALGGPAGRALARAVVGAVDKYVPRLRARISALAPRRPGKGRMDIKLILAAIRAALTAEDPKPGLEALMTELDGMQGDVGEGDAQKPPAREGEPPKPDAGPPKPDARAYGREDEKPMARGRGVDVEVARARKGADMSVSTGIRARLREETAAGLVLDTKLETELAAMRDPDAFEQRIADLTRGRAMASQGQQRARSGVQQDGAPPPAGSGEAPMTAAQLAAEGFDPRWIAGYHEEHKADPHAAAATLSGGRAGLARKATEAATARARAARDAGKGN